MVPSLGGPTEGISCSVTAPRRSLVAQDHVPQPHDLVASPRPVAYSAPMTTPTTAQALVAELLGTALLVAVVVGSGIMGDTLAGGNVAVALLANTVATGAALYVLIQLFGPVSGAHFNPVVSLVFVLDRSLAPVSALGYVGAQALGGVAGTVLAHAMFDQPLIQASEHVRRGTGVLVSEVVATFALLLVILGTSRRNAKVTPGAVALTVVAGYWFTASTSFANPAVAFARAFTNTFAGIRLADVPAFALAELLGALLAFRVAAFLVPKANDLA
jgi:glycerol uptake facilitator-like aquaporin